MSLEELGNPTKIQNKLYSIIVNFGDEKKRIPKEKFGRKNKQVKDLYRKYLLTNTHKGEISFPFEITLSLNSISRLIVIVASLIVCLFGLLIFGIIVHEISTVLISLILIIIMTFVHIFFGNLNRRSIKVDDKGIYIRFLNKIKFISKDNIEISSLNMAGDSQPFIQFFTIQKGKNGRDKLKVLLGIPQEIFDYSILSFFLELAKLWGLTKTYFWKGEYDLDQLTALIDKS